MMRKDYCIAVIRRPLGNEILDRRSREDRKIAGMNGGYVAEGKLIEIVLDAREARSVDTKRFPLTQTTLVGVA